MTIFKSEDASTLRSCVVHYQNWLSKNVDQPVQSALGLQPQELGDTFVKLTELNSLLSKSQDGQIDIDNHFLPLLKKAIIQERRSEAFDVEKRSGFTFNHDLRARLDERLTSFSIVMNEYWFEHTGFSGLPKITDYLSIQYAEELLKKRGGLGLGERMYDEKFHILTAPSLFIPDLAYYRATCELRSTPVCVAYLDIDDFKQFNTEYGEPRVDRDVLPKFMSSLESHVYSHGHAYRFGGDEYTVILPNMPSSHAVGFLKSFQKKLRELTYFEVYKRTEVSVGIVEVSENSIQTDREVEERAAYAKNFAKEQGKNCIATFEKQGYEDSAVYVVQE
ncbi:MAG: GGDEF domain-containing protein [bacterium]|nr:GGDEF domain-containing protein [bacterium]